MEAYLKFGNARIHFDIDQYDHADDGEDFIGGGNASVSARDWLRVHKRQEFSTYSVEAHEIEHDYKENNQEEVSISNDDFIVFLNAIASEPKRTYRISWNGLAYWLWHDTVHAQHDVYGGAVNVNDASEERTLYEGAKLARQNGTSLEQIVRELVRAENEFARRFKRPTNALERFLHDIDQEELVSK